MKTKIIILFAALFAIPFLTPHPLYAASCQTNQDCYQDPRLEGCSSQAGRGYICLYNNQSNNQKNNINNVKCITQSGENGVNTALGCISTDFGGGGFIKNILQLGIGIGGAIALILIVYGLFLITTSGGIPDKVNAGKEVITSAIAGLIFIIFSTILMNIIGINILGLPGLQ